MNNRVVANGTPLERRFESFATVARRAGYDPTLFGYTDQGLDPFAAVGTDDPRLDYYDGVLTGLSVGLYLPESQAGWVQYLRAKGYDVPSGWAAALRGEPDRPAEDSLSGFLTTRFLEWLGRQESGWFAHLSYLRPHPPYAAAGEFASRYHPDDVDLPIAPATDDRHQLHDTALNLRASAAPSDEREMRHLRAQYYGMISEVDEQVGRVVRAIEERNEWDETLVVVTADHGEQLGDHGLIEKLGFFPQSYHIIGLWRDPRRAPAGVVVTQFTENVDLLVTLSDALEVSAPVQCDGRSLLPLFEAGATEWRAAAHYEWDFRSFFIGRGGADWPADRSLSRHNLAVSVSDDTAYVQFGDGSFRCYDVAADPTWRTPCRETERILAAAQEQLQWRQEHLRRDVTDMVLGRERRGRWPRLSIAG